MVATVQHRGRSINSIATVLVAQGAASGENQGQIARRQLHNISTNAEFSAFRTTVLFGCQRTEIIESGDWPKMAALHPRFAKGTEIFMRTTFLEPTSMREAASSHGIQIAR